MHIRRYQPGEEQQLWSLFFNTIHTVNTRDYTQEQVDAWAPQPIDPAHWQKRIAGMNPWVCIADDTITGYASLLDTGYVDHFYVHHQWQRRGVGSKLFAQINEHASSLGLTQLTSDVSITARPFFEANGFTVVAPQQVTINGVTLQNFRMQRPHPTHADAQEAPPLV